MQMSSDRFHYMYGCGCECVSECIFHEAIISIYLRFFFIHATAEDTQGKYTQIHQFGIMPVHIPKKKTKYKFVIMSEVWWCEMSIIEKLFVFHVFVCTVYSWVEDDFWSIEAQRSLNSHMCFMHSTFFMYFLLFYILLLTITLVFFSHPSFSSFSSSSIPLPLWRELFHPSHSNAIWSDHFQPNLLLELLFSQFCFILDSFFWTLLLISCTNARIYYFVNSCASSLSFL